MGSVTIIFIIPIMLIVMLFGTIAGFVKGDIETEVQFPYNPSEGLVWEYDGVDDPLFELVEVETEGDVQTFVFKGISVFDAMKGEVDSELVMDVVFSNEKGEELIYYARVNHDYISFYEKIEFYSPDEYVFFRYTPKEETTVDGAEWNLWANCEHLYDTKEIDGEKTYTLLYIPDKTYGTVFHEEFFYSKKATETTDHAFCEKIILEIKTEVGKCEIKSETRNYYDGNRWLSYNPALRENGGE